MIKYLFVIKLQYLNFLIIFHIFHFLSLVYEYLVYTRYRFLQRESRWKGTEDSLDECIDESMRTLDQMCFSSQFYLSMTIHANGIVFFVLGVEMMARANHNFFGDPATLILSIFVLLTSWLVKKLLIWSALLLDIWKIRHENTAWHVQVRDDADFVPSYDDIIGECCIFITNTTFDINNLFLHVNVFLNFDGSYEPPILFLNCLGASHDAFELNRRISSETFRYKFLNYNRSWLIGQLPNILTPRTLRRSHPYLVNQLSRVLKTLNDEISSDDDDDVDNMAFEVPALNFKNREMLNWWVKQARRRLKMKEVVQPFIQHARGIYCERCLSQKLLKIETKFSFEEMDDRFTSKYSSEDQFDQVLWKQFWQRHQKYNTICLPCIANLKEIDREKAIFQSSSNIVKSNEDEDPNWGPIMLEERSTSIMKKWYQAAQSRVFGEQGRQREQILIDISDDEGDDMTFSWAQKPLSIESNTKTIATLWLRTARSKMKR